MLHPSGAPVLRPAAPPKPRPRTARQWRGAAGRVRRQRAIRHPGLYQQGGGEGGPEGAECPTVRTIERQLEQERRKLQNLIAAIEAVSGAPSSLLKAIADREGAMKPEGEHRKTVDKPAGPGFPDVAGWVEKQLRELTGVLKVNPAKVKIRVRPPQPPALIHPHRGGAPSLPQCQRPVRLERAGRFLFALPIPRVRFWAY